MTEILNQGIKDVLKSYPAVEAVLAGYNIGCTTCGLGTCLLKDIVEIHNLSVEQETLLMERIAGIVYPGKTISYTPQPRKQSAKSPGASMSPPLRSLVDEHAVIKRFIALVPRLLEENDPATDSGKSAFMTGVNFVKTFADSFHHAKEEDILFGYFDRNSEIIDSFTKEHELGRNHIRNVVKGCESGNQKLVSENLLAYGALLTEHIKKEDEILYPWMNRSLSDSKVGELFSKFAEVDGKFSSATKNGLAYISDLEKQYGKN